MSLWPFPGIDIWDPQNVKKMLLSKKMSLGNNVRKTTLRHLKCRFTGFRTLTFWGPQNVEKMSLRFPAFGKMSNKCPRIFRHLWKCQKMSAASLASGGYWRPWGSYMPVEDYLLVSLRVRSGKGGLSTGGTDGQISQWEIIHCCTWGLGPPVEHYLLAPFSVRSTNGRLSSGAPQSQLRQWKITHLRPWKSDPPLEDYLLVLLRFSLPVELLLQSSIHRLRKGLAKLLGACWWSDSWQHALYQLRSGCVYKNLSCCIMFFTDMNSRQCRGSEMCFRCWWLCVSEATQRLGKIHTHRPNNFQWPWLRGLCMLHVSRARLCFQNWFAKCQQKRRGATDIFFTFLRHFRRHTPEGTPRHFFDI